MKKGKAEDHDDIPVEVWIALEADGVQFVTNLFNRLLREKKMPNK